MTALALIRDVLARVVTAREELAAGDTMFAAQVLEDLEVDLTGWLERHSGRA